MKIVARAIAPLILSALTVGAGHAAEPGQIAGTVAASLETLGQGLADTAGGAPSVFVSATGHAPRPGRAKTVFVINFEGKANNAAGAAQTRDHDVEVARSIAKSLGMESETAGVSFARETEAAAPAAFARPNPTPGAPPPLFIAPVAPTGSDEMRAKMFVFRGTVRFYPSDPARTPVLLDRLTAGGIDFTVDASQFNQSYNPLQYLATAGAETIDQATWDRASLDAMGAAKRQAALLAEAAGRRLGEARQILLLARSAQNDAVSVTVAVRYGLAPAS